jgi:SPP1 family predicted phage head-tail adaptor
MPDYGRGAGRYNNRLRVEQNVPVTDTAGQRNANWMDWIGRWAEVIPRGGSEKRIFEQLRPEVDALIRLRFDSDIKTIFPANFRFNVGGEIYNIESMIDVDTRRFEFEFRCTKVQKNAY